MNSILTDDERPKLPPAKNYFGDDTSWGYDASDMEAYADAREAAVLAKLREQEPVAMVDGQWNSLHIRFLPSGWSLEKGDQLYAAPLPAVVQVPEWSLKASGDIGAIFDEKGRKITTCYLAEAREIVDAHNAGIAAAPEAPALPAEVREAIKVARKALVYAKGWHHGDKWRFDGTAQQQESWKQHAATLDAAIARLDALGGRE